MFKPTTASSVEDYLNQIAEPRQTEIKTIHDFICAAIPDQKPFIIHNIIGYGKTYYKSKSGSEGDWFIVGLASQKNYISIYACATIDGMYIAEKYADKLGKASIGRSCIRYKKSSDIPWDELKKVIIKSFELVKEHGLFM
jgi:hypothetical protein